MTATGGFTVVDRGAGVSVFFGLLGLVVLLGPWFRAWRDGELGGMRPAMARPPIVSKVTSLTG